MALRTIRTMGDEILKKSCRDVVEMKPRLLQLVDDMLETMYEARGSWAGSPTGRRIA